VDQSQTFGVILDKTIKQIRSDLKLMLPPTRKIHADLCCQS